MNAAYFHLLAGHVSVLLACGIALLLFGELRGDGSVRTAGTVLLALSSAIVVLLYLSGDGAREIVIEATSVADEIIDRHQASARPAAIAGIALGLAAAVALVVRRRPGRLPRGLRVLVAVLALATLGLIVVTARDGGRIRHPEVVGPTDSVRS